MHTRSAAMHTDRAARGNSSLQRLLSIAGVCAVPHDIAFFPALVRREIRLRTTAAFHPKGTARHTIVLPFGTTRYNNMCLTMRYGSCSYLQNKDRSSGSKHFDEPSFLFCGASLR